MGASDRRVVASHILVFTIHSHRGLCTEEPAIARIMELCYDQRVFPTRLYQALHTP